MTRWVGLTGGIGSGKSTVADMFAAYGVPLIDTDIIARTLCTASGAAVPALREAFGKEIIDEAGSLKREAMRHLMLAIPAAKQQLEQILHPLIRSEIRRIQALHNQAVYGLVAIPLLAENPVFLQLVDRVLLVDCRESDQIERIQHRNRFTREEAKALLAAQTTRTHRLSIAHDIIENHADVNELQPQITVLHQFYLEHFAHAAC